MKQIEVTIMGQSYVLGCPDGGEASLLAAVANVDAEMCAIRDGGKVKARERIAVLAALNLAYRLEEKPEAATASSGAAATASSGAAAAAVVNGAAEPTTADQDAVDLATLVSRIDQALGEGGHLL